MPERSKLEDLLEITFEASDGGVEGTFRVFGGVRDALWTTYLAIQTSMTGPSTSSSSSASGYNDDFSPSFSFSAASLPRQSLSLNVVDLCTPYYSSPQGLAKLQAMIEILQKKVIVLQSEQIVPVLGVKLLDGGRRTGKRLCVLSGRVGRGERLRGVLRVCGRMDLGVARDHLIQVLAGLEAMREQGVTHDGPFFLPLSSVTFIELIGPFQTSLSTLSSSRRRLEALVLLSRVSAAGAHSRSPPRHFEPNRVRMASLTP